MYYANSSMPLNAIIVLGMEGRIFFYHEKKNWPGWQTGKRVGRNVERGTRPETIVVS